MTSIPQPDFSFNVSSELERLQGFNPIRGASTMKEWRRERWRDWQEANGRTFGWFGSNRDLQFAYLHAAEVARRGGNYLLAKLHASCSREERRRSYINSLSPMALIEREANDLHGSPL
jgi:hypothetical protein